MERKKDKKVLKSKTLPPRKTYPAEFDDFDFFSSTDSSTDWEVRSDSNTNWTFTPPSTLSYTLYPTHVQLIFVWGGGNVWFWSHQSFLLPSLHFKFSKNLRYSVSKFVLKSRSREEKKIVSEFTNFQKPFILKSESSWFNVPAFMHLANIYLIYPNWSVWSPCQTAL